MGVKGLATFITKNKAPNDEITFPLPNNKRATVLIDSLSINLAKEGYKAFRTVHKNDELASLYPDSDIVGGECSLMAEATRKFLTTMRDHLHMNIRLLRDARRFKEKQESLVEELVMTSTTENSAGTVNSCVGYEARNLTLNTRSKEREREIERVLRYVYGLPDTEQQKKYFHSPKPQLCPHNFGMIIESVVQELNEEANSRGDPPSTQILVHRAVQGECDEEIGQLVVDSNADLVISSDSDLIVTNHGAPVTLFSWVNFGDLMNSPETLGSVIRFPVFSHARLCSNLNLSPSLSALQRAHQPGSSSQNETKSLMERFLAIPNDDSLFLYVACGINGNDVIPDLPDSGNGHSLTSYLNRLNSLTETINKNTHGEKWGDSFYRRSIIDVCHRLRLFRQEARRERLQATWDKEGNSLTSTPFLTCLSEWLSDDSSLLKASTENYLQSSSFRFPNADSEALSETIEMSPLPPPKFAPHLFRYREQLGCLLNLHLDDQVGTSFLTLVDGFKTAEEMDDEYCFYRLASSTHPFHKLKTTTRVLGLEYALIEAQRKVMGVQSDVVTMGSPGDTLPTTDARTAPVTTWYDAIQSPEAVRQQMFFNVFNPKFRTVAEGIDAAARSNSSENISISSNNSVFASYPSSFHPTCVQAILWLLHPALFDDELRVMAAFLMFMSATSQQQRKLLKDMKEGLPKESQKNSSSVSSSVSPPVVDVITPGGKKHIPSLRRFNQGQGLETPGEKHSDRMYTRPSPREVELSFLFRHAVEALNSVGKTLRFDSTDHMFVPSPTTFSHIVQSFSGSALHYMYTLRSNLESVECLQDITRSDVYLSMIQEVLENANRFQTWVRRQTGGSDGMNIREKAKEVGLGKGDTGNASVHGAIWRSLPELEDSKVVLADSSLPILEYIPEIIQAVNTNNVVCIQGETGCGKTSRIPLEIYRDAVSREKQVKIVVTQPRRIAVVSVASYVASLLGETVGETVGYRIGGGSQFWKESPQTCIFFVTTGYLLESLIGSSSFWKKVTHFILDEVHERSIEFDILSLIIKVRLGEEMGLSLWDFEELDEKALEFDTMGTEINESIVSQKECSEKKLTTEDEHLLAHSKLLVMSATIQAKLFQRYFAPLMQERCLPPEIFVGAKRFPVKEYFLDEFISSLPNIPGSVRTSLRSYCNVADKGKCPTLSRANCTSFANVIHFCVKPGTSILVFLPGWDAIESMMDALSFAGDTGTTLRIFPIHSTMDIDDQQKSITLPEKNVCNIILATNIAETSITIPSLRTVIDAGMCKRLTYDVKRKIKMLSLQWCSKSGAKQRAGRSGRVSPGLVIRMYTKKVFEEHMRDFDPVEYNPLQLSVLQISQHLSHLGDIRRAMCRLLEPPSIYDVSDAITSLIHLNALDMAEQVTYFGRTALKLSVDIRMAMGLLLAASLGCAAEMVVIVAGLSMEKELFSRPLPCFYDSQEEFQQKVVEVANMVSRFQNTSLSDPHVFLAIYQQFDDLAKKKEVKSTLAWRSIKVFRNSVKNLARRFKTLNIPLDTNDQECINRLISSEDTENWDGSESITSQSLSKSSRDKTSFPVIRPPFLNSLLQIALVSTSQWSIVLQRVVNKEKYGKNPKESFSTPALCELPWGTKRNLNPTFLSSIVKIRPIGFLHCDPHILPYYLCRTALFSLPEKLKKKICEELQKSGCEDRIEEDCGWTAPHSPAVEAFECVLSKIFGEKVALTVSLVHSLVVLTINPTALGIKTRESGNGNNPGMVYTGQSTQGKVTLINNSKKNAPAPSKENETTKQIPEDSITTIKEVPSSKRFRLLPLHPSLVGIITSQLISREKVEIPLTLDSWGRKEREAVTLSNFTVAFRKYSLCSLEEHSPTNAMAEIWRTLCCPYVLPVLSKATDANGVPPSASSSQTTSSTTQKELQGIGEGPLFAASFSASKCYNKLRFGHSIVLLGTPLQLLLSIASNSFVFDKVQNNHTVELEFTLECEDGPLLPAGWRMFYISKFETLSLINTFNTNDLSISNSSRGAPLYGLVSLLALSILSHASKFPSCFHETTTKLVSLINSINILSQPLPDSSEKELVYSTVDVVLEYRRYQFFNESYAWLPDVEQVMLQLSNAPSEMKKSGEGSIDSSISLFPWEFWKEVCQIQSEICSLCASSEEV